MGVYYSLCPHGNTVTFISVNMSTWHNCWRCLEAEAYLLYEVAQGQERDAL